MKPHSLYQREQSSIPIEANDVNNTNLARGSFSQGKFIQQRYLMNLGG